MTVREITRFATPSPVPYVASGYNHYFAQQSRQGVILNGRTDGSGTFDIPIAPAYVGLTVWATQLADPSVGNYTPQWVSSSGVVTQWAPSNVCNVNADGSHIGTMAAWVITIPADTVAVRIGLGNSVSQLQIWQPSSAWNPAVGNANPNEITPFTDTQSRTSTYVVAGCIGIDPRISIPYKRFGLVLPSGLGLAIGWAHNTPGVGFPVTFSASSRIGYYAWFTDQLPPDLQSY